MRRVELRHKHLELITQSAAFENAHKSPESAKKYYELAISIDPYQDHLHLALMKCLVDMKAPAAAKAHFKYYARILDQELGIEPLEELKAFYKSI